MESDAEEDDIRTAITEDGLLGRPPVEDDVLEPPGTGLLLQQIESLGVDIDPADTAARPDQPRRRKREEPVPAPDVDECLPRPKADP